MQVQSLNNSLIPKIPICCHIQNPHKKAEHPLFILPKIYYNIKINKKGATRKMESQIIHGVITGVVFQNYDNGYCVLRLKTEDDQQITVVGTIPLPSPGERLMVTGKWNNHTNYGRQFEAEFLERLMPQTQNEIMRYLSGRVIKGIGPKMAARIVDRFGEHTLQIMEREPHRLAEVTGISSAKAKAIGEEFRLQVGLRHLMEFFTLHQLSAELAVKTYKLYGENTIELLYDDPYLLMDPGLDAPFGAVDQFAITLGIAGDDPRRIEAGILFELRYNLLAGHSFLPQDKLIAATGQLLSVSEDAVQLRMEKLIQSQRLISTVLAGITVTYLPELYQAEIYSSRKLTELSKQPICAPASLNKMLKIAASESGIAYSAQQEQAIRNAAESGLLVVTGGPGTGKTTIINGILSLYDQMGIRCLLAAPTGRAAKRMTEVTGRDASTIHRLLDAGIQPGTGELVFTRDESNPLKANAVIVDEFSMVDIQLLFALLQAVPYGCRLILVGDADQLPPVGPGFPLRDILRSNTLPTVHLTEIFRQAQESLIVMNAHRVNQGELPQLRDVKRDFFFLPARSEEEVGMTIAGLCTTRLPERMGIPPEQIQVLTPTKKGLTGTASLNRLLQDKLNPAVPNKRERAFGDFFFREGDRVMQVRNNYDIVWKKTDGSAIGTGIFNGDVGIVRSVDTQMEQITVVFDDREADYDFTQLGELEPAYAMTVHKSQGSGATRSLVKS